MTVHFTYTNKDSELIEFASWVEKVLQSREFLDTANEFIKIEQQLKNEPVGPRRSELVQKSSKIRYGFDL